MKLYKNLEIKQTLQSRNVHCFSTKTIIKINRHSKRNYNRCTYIIIQSRQFYWRLMTRFCIFGYNLLFYIYLLIWKVFHTILLYYTQYINQLKYYELDRSFYALYAWNVITQHLVAFLPLIRIDINIYMYDSHSYALCCETALKMCF